MDPAQIQQVYELESQNVRALLGTHRKQLLRELNRSLVLGDQTALRTKTFLYVLMYCSWAEAQLMQMIHTPRALTAAEIDVVKASHERNIENAWHDLIKLAFARVGGLQADVKQKREFVWAAVQLFSVGSAQLRNKIAHGQWAVALNRKHTRESAELTLKLQTLDFVQIDLMFDVQQVIGFIVRDLLQSPKNSHYNQFWQHHTQLEQLIANRADWTMQTKKAKLERRRREQ